MQKSSEGFFGSSVVPFRIVFIMWLVFSIQFFYGFDFGVFGIRPRTVPGLIGIFAAPLIHGDYYHLLSNTFPLLFLGSALYFFYERIGGTVFFRCYFYTNFLVWLLSPRDSYHIGASGLVYGITSFLIFFGLIRQDFISLIIAVVVLMIYGGVFISGVIPSDPRISWEAHLAGALVGGFTAFNLAPRKNIR
jgi:membrane associated rhomboid family serine protease